MASLALKALSYGAEHIPDKFFDALPGGYFKSQAERESKKRRKDVKKRGKSRAQSEGRGRRRRSPSLTESDYYTSDYSDEDSDYERRRRDRRSSDADRGRYRGRERDRDRKQRHHHHKDGSWSRDGNSPAYADRSKSLGAPNNLHIPPPPVPPSAPPAAFPPAHLAGENYAHPQPYNAAHSHYVAKPYNPADYVPGATQNHELANGQPAQVNSQALAQVPNVNQHPTTGYYGTQFPPPPPGSRSSRASSVDSRGLHSGSYIPHSKVQAIAIPNSTAGASGYSPYGTSFQSVTNTPLFGHTPPQYLPQNSSPYQPNYSPNYSPSYPVQQPLGHGSQPVSRHGSIHSATAHGGQIGDGHRSHDRHRRHSIATNPDPRAAYRTPYRSGAGSSTTSASNSIRGSVAEAIHEVSSQADGSDDRTRAIIIPVSEKDVGTVLGAASEGLTAAEALRKRHQARPSHRSRGGRRAVRSAPADGYGSA